LSRPRFRELGLSVGTLPTGPHNAITDVSEVRVGHATLIAGAGPLRPGTGPVRTGVTVIRPHGGNLFREKVRAAVHTINGFGKACGFEQVRELGTVETPIALTNTLNVGLVFDALVQSAIEESPEIGITTAGTVNPVVGECNDSFLNDIQGRHVRLEHVRRALEGATDGPVAEGAVGAGTGTTCFGWKGGIGTASRVLPAAGGGFTVGALVQSNFGRAADLTVCGVPVGRHLAPPDRLAFPPERGSIMIVLATDAPLDARQLHRIAVRASAGLARLGSHLGHGSGDFVIAFSTAGRVLHAPRELVGPEVVVRDEPRAMEHLFPAVVESVEEAVLNSLTMAETTTGRDDHVRHAVPLERLTAIVRGACGSDATA
jgi:D-aminopeptidase